VEISYRVLGIGYWVLGSLELNLGVGRMKMLDARIKIED
jgi:hypothetical protein